MAQGLLGGELLAFLLGIAEAGAKLESLDAYTSAEGGAVGTYDTLTHEFELQLVLHLLAPLDESALEVVILLGHLVNVDMLAYDATVEETIAIAVAAVKVDGTNKSFEGIARNEAVVGAVDVGRLYEFDQSCLLGKAVETAALHNLTSHRGEEALLLAGEVMVEDIAHHSFNDGIAQVFEALIVLLLVVGTVVVDRAMHQRFAINGHLAGIEAQDAMQLAAEFLIATEKITQGIYKRAIVHETMILEESVWILPLICFYGLFGLFEVILGTFTLSVLANRPLFILMRIGCTR